MEQEYQQLLRDLDQLNVELSAAETAYHTADRRTFDVIAKKDALTALKCKRMELVHKFCRDNAYALQQRRYASAKSQAEVAYECGVTQAMISVFENGNLFRNSVDRHLQLLAYYMSLEAPKKFVFQL